MDAETDRRPVLTTVPEPASESARDVYWLIDGNIFPKPPGSKGSMALHTPTRTKSELARTDSSVGTRELTDIEGRLADMDKGGMETQVIYPTLVPDQGAYRDQPWRGVGDFPVARSLTPRLLCLPMFAELTDAEVDRVGRAVRDFYGAA